MDKALKQRLVGASVLILLAIIVLPMLLSGQSETLQQETVRIEVPERPPELTFETRRFPVGDTPPGAPSTLPANDGSPEPPPVDPSIDETAPETGIAAALETAPGADAEGSASPSGEVAAGEGVAIAALPAPSTLEDEPGALLGESPPATGAGVEPLDPAPVGRDSPGDGQSPVVESSPPPPGGRYLVQVASYTIAANADNLASKLGALGMTVQRDTVENDANRYHRVRVGPFDDADAAEAAIARITREISDLEPRIVDLMPDALTPVTDPGDPLVRWVVQAGSFSSEANADKLVGELRAAGFEAYREKVSEASTTLFKVRIGPELRRESAVEVAGRLERQFDIRGLVMSTD